VERALVYLKNLDASGGKNRDLQLELALAYDKIGQVQGSPGRANTGDLSGAVQSFGRARQILKGLLQGAPTDLKLREALAAADEHQADIHEQRGEMPIWRQLRKEATALRWAIAREHPETPCYRAAALWNDAYTLGGENRPAEAVVTYEKALAANQEALAREPGDAALIRNAARIQRNLAHAYQDSGHYDEALTHYREALRIDKERLAAAPGDTRTKMEISWDYTETGWIEHVRHREHEAEQCFVQALGLQEELFAADPQNLLARLEIGKLKLTAAPATEDAGDRALAIRYLQDATGIFQAALQRDPSNDDARFHLGWAWANLGDVYLRGDGQARAQARPYFERAADVLRGLKMEGRPDGGLDPKALIAHVSDVLAERRGHRK
jgi:tetratricopeptide (TPR) repeat protein